jgi:hypothetical protein
VAGSKTLPAKVKLPVARNLGPRFQGTIGKHPVTPLRLKGLSEPPEKFLLTANAYRDGEFKDWITLGGVKHPVTSAALETITNAIIAAGLPTPFLPASSPGVTPGGEIRLSIIIPRALYDALALWWESPGLNDVALGTYLAKTFRGEDAEAETKP